MRVWKVQRKPESPLRRLEVSFTGSRVDVVTDAESAEAVRVTVDGAKPSELSSIRSFGRTTLVPGRPWPALTSVESIAPRLAETWTVTILGLSENNSRIEFRVDGSKTGFDGTGTSLTNFVSNSGRVVIPAWSWLLGYALNSAGVQLPEGYRVEWKSDWVGTDEFRPQAPRGAGTESTVTLASGLPDGVHRLVLEGTSLAAVKSLRVFRPKGAVAVGEISREEAQIRPTVGWRYRLGGWSFELRGNGLSDVTVESSTNLVDWLPVAGTGQSLSEWLPELRDDVRYFRIRGGP